MTTRPNRHELDDVDRELLNAVQWDFPLEPRPFAVLGERLGITEAEVRERIAKVEGRGRAAPALGDLRHPGARLLAPRSSRRKIDPDRVDEAAAVISAHPGVSHNYKRNHAYNLWYTIAVPPGDVLDEHIDVLHRESGALVTRKLPTLKLYKIGVKLDMTGNTAADAKAEVLEHERPERTSDMAAPELVRPRGRGDPHRAGRPPDGRAPVRGARPSRSASTRQTRARRCSRSFKERKLMRRFAAVMNHRSAGFKANAMGVWAVPDDELDEIGPQMASFARGEPLLPPPDLRRLAVHACSRWCTASNARDCEATIEAIRDETGVDEYACCGRSRSTRRSACATSAPSGTTGRRATPRETRDCS